MENDSLEALKSLIEEEIYLLPNDQEAILGQLENDVNRSPETQSGLPGPAPTVVKKEDAPALTPKVKPQIHAEEVIKEPIPVRGNFSKGLLVLHEEEILTDDVMEMLVKMVKACGHSMTEVGMLASSVLENRSMEEFQNLNAHTVLKFGRIKHPINAIPTRLYEVYSEKGTEYLFADSLSEISEDKTLKQKLWTSLQVLFNLSSKK